MCVNPRHELYLSRACLYSQDVLIEQRHFYHAIKRICMRNRFLDFTNSQFIIKQRMYLYTVYQEIFVVENFRGCHITVKISHTDTS